MPNRYTKEEWKEYYQKNKEKRLRQCKEYCMRNIEKVKSRKRKYYCENKKILLPKIRLRDEIKRYSRPRIEIINILGNKCFKCKKECNEKNLQIHHIDGTGQSKKPNNNIKNLQILCHSCHVKKTFKKVHRWLIENCKCKTSKQKFIYSNKKYREYRKNVIKKFNYTCQKCNKNYCKNTAKLRMCYIKDNTIHIFCSSCHGKYKFFNIHNKIRNYWSNHN